MARPGSKLPEGSPLRIRHRAHETIVRSQSRAPGHPSRSARREARPCALVWIPDPAFRSAGCRGAAWSTRWKSPDRRRTSFGTLTLILPLAQFTGGAAICHPPRGVLTHGHHHRCCRSRTFCAGFRNDRSGHQWLDREVRDTCRQFRTEVSLAEAADLAVTIG
jgi:hypothetical protein